MFYRRVVAAGLVLIALSALSAPPAVGQTPAEEPDPVLALLDEKVDSFLADVQAGQTATDYETALDGLLTGSQLGTSAEAKDALIANVADLPKRFGACRGYEQVAAKRVGQDLVLMKYLYKCQSFPVVWYFTFYRTAEEDEDWRVIIVRFDTELELLWLQPAGGRT